MLLDVSIVGDPAYRAGGVWLAGDEPHLPPRLAVLAEQFDRAPPLGARGPPEVVRIDLCPRSTNSRRGVPRVFGDIRMASIVFIEDRRIQSSTGYGPQSGPAAGTAR